MEFIEDYPALSAFIASIGAVFFFAWLSDQIKEPTAKKAVTFPCVFIPACWCVFFAVAVANDLDFGNFGSFIFLCFGGFLLYAWWKD